MTNQLWVKKRKQNYFSNKKTRYFKFLYHKKFVSSLTSGWVILTCEEFSNDIREQFIDDLSLENFLHNKKKVNIDNSIEISKMILSGEINAKLL